MFTINLKTVPDFEISARCDREIEEKHPLFMETVHNEGAHGHFGFWPNLDQSLRQKSWFYCSSTTRTTM